MAKQVSKSKSGTPDTAQKTTPGEWRPFESLRREVDRLFEDFDKDAWRGPFQRSLSQFEPIWRQGTSWAATVPAVDVVEKDNAFELTAELPGMDEKDIEVKVAGGRVTVSGQKTEEKDEKRKDVHLSERRFGSFTRSFPLPTGTDADKIEAKFDKGVLKVTMPKTPEARREKKISVKPA